MEEIREITATETHSVRHPVLRAGKPIETCIFEGDEKEDNIHLGYFINCALIGIASLYHQAHPELKANNAYQLRGMAVLPHHQGHGYGEALVKEALVKVQVNNGDLLWCNARIKAVPFYKKMGFEVFGSPFDIGDIGTHYVMYHQL